MTHTTPLPASPFLAEIITRKVATARAKEAYRLFITRAVSSAGFSVHVWGYCYICEGWEVCLTNEGKLDAVVRASRVQS